MFEEYFISMLTATSHRIVHLLSPIWAIEMGSSVQTWALVLSHKKYSKGDKSNDLCGQLTAPGRDTKCVPNLPLNKSII